jgi:hypothetical protein
VNFYHLQQLASHGLFDVRVKAKGDTHIDDHHTNEDIALALGTVCSMPIVETFFKSPFCCALGHVFNVFLLNCNIVELCCEVFRMKA